MAGRESQVSPSTVLARGAEATRALVREALTRDDPALGQFNWHGLADAAAANARQSANSLASPLSRYPAPRRAALQAALRNEQATSADTAESEWLARAIDAWRWAEAAVATYDFLADKTTRDDGRGYDDSAMHLRAYLMTRIGIIPGDRVLDSNVLLTYFSDGLTLSADEASVSARAIRERLLGSARPPDLLAELRMLRGIKNRLAPLALLVGSGQFEPPSSLRPWLQLREQLP